MMDIAYGIDIGAEGEVRHNLSRFECGALIITHSFSGLSVSARGQEMFSTLEPRAKTLSS